MPTTFVCKDKTVSLMDTNLLIQSSSLIQDMSSNISCNSGIAVATDHVDSSILYYLIQLHKDGIVFDFNSIVTPHIVDMIKLADYLGCHDALNSCCRHLRIRLSTCEDENATRQALGVVNDLSHSEQKELKRRMFWTNEH